MKLWKRRKPLNPDRFDAMKPEEYLKTYETYFAPLADDPVRLLELGVHEGGSLRMWSDYFPNGVIAGIDNLACPVDDDSGRIRVFQGQQQDTEFLDRVAAEVAPGGFDIIIDDASHIAEWTKISFWHLFTRHLKPGGLYVIEDWGVGYWPSRPDGGLFHEPADEKQPADEFARRFPSHEFGMAGLLKQLIDECGIEDITHPDKGGLGPLRLSRFEKIIVGVKHAIVFKAGGGDGDDAAGP